MTYVDLNPIRAGICQSPEASDHTSIQERIKHHGKVRAQWERESKVPLASFATGLMAAEGELPISLDDYLELVDWAGRAMRDDKRGHIPAHLAPILVRTGIQPNSWLDEMQKIEVGFHYAIGPIELLKRFGKSVRRHWIKGKASASKLFQPIAT